MKENGQGTVKMSFEDKRKFFLYKQIESTQPRSASDKSRPKKLWVNQTQDFFFIKSVFYREY